MTAYNHEQFIGEALESVLRQQFKDFEIVIIDDASSDRTPHIIAEYTKRYRPKIKPIYHQHNEGITSTFIEALRQLSGTYAAFLSGDDIFLPGKLARQTDIMERDLECVISYHDVDVFESDTGRTIKCWNTGPDSSSGREGDTGSVLRDMLENIGDFMLSGAVMVRRKAIPRSCVYPDTPVVDLLFHLEVLAQNPGKVRFINEILFRYRRHRLNITSQMTTTSFHREVRAALENFREHHPSLGRYARRGVGLSFYREALVYMRGGDYKRAAPLFSRAICRGRVPLALKSCARLLGCHLQKLTF
jgi:glycosyltransferase involved in cell wall biosynthesis